MNLTSSQKKAIVFILVFFQLAVIYHWIDRALNPVEPFDFSQFEAHYYARFDSIQRVLGEDSLQADSAISLIEESTSNPHVDRGSTGDISRSHNYSTKRSQNSANRLVNINTAPVKQLMALPRVGPVIAARIVEYRLEHGKFKTKAELLEVKGIGPKTFKKLEGLVSLE